MGTRDSSHSALECPNKSTGLNGGTPDLDRTADLRAWRGAVAHPHRSAAVELTTAARGLVLGGWLLTSTLAVIGLLMLGHGLLLDMTHGSDHRTGLDLIGGGALIALGGRELIRGVLDDGAAPAWSGAVDRFAAMPLPLLLLISSVTEVISPDDLLLFAKSAAVILTAQLPLQEEIACSIGFSFAATALLLVPFLTVLIGR